MLISSSVTRALDEVAARERDVLQAYAPGAAPAIGDVAQTPQDTPALDPLSAVPPEGCYFLVAGEDGRTLFTRDGTFALQDGRLVDVQGRRVLGFSGTPGAMGGVQLDPVDAALGYAGGVRIEPDGTLAYARTVIEPQSGRVEQQRGIAGRLALARFPAGTKLRALDPQHFAAPDGIAPHIGRAGDGNFAALAPFARAGSGVNLDLGLQRLQEAYLALDAIRAAGKAQGSAQKTAMDLLK